MAGAGAGGRVLEDDAGEGTEEDRRCARLGVEPLGAVTPQAFEVAGSRARSRRIQRSSTSPSASGWYWTPHARGPAPEGGGPGRGRAGEARRRRAASKTSSFEVQGGDRIVQPPKSASSRPPPACARGRASRPGDPRGGPRRPSACASSWRAEADPEHRQLGGDRVPQQRRLRPEHRVAVGVHRRLLAAERPAAVDLAQRGQLVAAAAEALVELEPGFAQQDLGVPEERVLEVVDDEERPAGTRGCCQACMKSCSVTRQGPVP